MKKFLLYTNQRDLEEVQNVAKNDTPIVRLSFYPQAGQEISMSVFGSAEEMGRMIDRLERRGIWYRADV